MLWLFVIRFIRRFWSHKMRFPCSVIRYSNIQKAGNFHFNFVQFSSVRVKPKWANDFIFSCPNLLIWFKARKLLFGKSFNTWNKHQIKIQTIFSCHHLPFRSKIIAMSCERMNVQRPSNNQNKKKKKKNVINCVASHIQSMSFSFQPILPHLKILQAKKINWKKTKSCLCLRFVSVFHGF